MAVIDRTWDEPTVFEAWGTIEHGASMFSTPENARAMRDSICVDQDEIPLFSVKGTSWNEVMTVYHEINGWKPYRPMEE